MKKTVLLPILFVVVQLAVGLMAYGQQIGKVPRIGYLDLSTASGTAVLLEAFRQELSKLAWIERQNIAIEYRYAEGKLDRLPELAADLVRLKVDVIVGAGLVSSLARPGGNVTGLSGLLVELNTKRLEILKDAIPNLVRVGLLRTLGGLIAEDLQLKELRPAALPLKLKLEEIKTQPDAKGLETAFQTAKRKQVTAIMTTTSRSFFAERKRIVELAGKYRLPAIYPQKE